MAIIDTEKLINEFTEYKVTPDGNKVLAKDYDEYVNALNLKNSIPNEIVTASDGKFIHNSQLESYENALKTIGKKPIETAIAKDGTEVIKEDLEKYEALCILIGKTPKDITINPLDQELTKHDEELNADQLGIRETIKNFVNDSFKLIDGFNEQNLDKFNKIVEKEINDTLTTKEPEIKEDEDVIETYDDDSLDVHYEEKEMNGYKIQVPSTSPDGKILTNAEYAMLQKPNEDNKILSNNNISTIKEMSSVDLSLFEDQIKGKSDNTTSYDSPIKTL